MRFVIEETTEGKGKVGTSTRFLKCSVVQVGLSEKFEEDSY